MPDPNTANIDPFMEETTLFMQCDVIEPSDGKGYDRDPRSIARATDPFCCIAATRDEAFEIATPSLVERYGALERALVLRA